MMWLVLPPVADQRKGTHSQGSYKKKFLTPILALTFFC